MVTLKPLWHWPRHTPRRNGFKLLDCINYSLPTSTSLHLHQRQQAARMPKFTYVNAPRQSNKNRNRNFPELQVHTRSGDSKNLKHTFQVSCALICIQKTQLARTHTHAPGLRWPTRTHSDKPTKRPTDRPTNRNRKYCAGYLLFQRHEHLTTATLVTAWSSVQLSYCSAVLAKSLFVCRAALPANITSSQRLNSGSKRTAATTLRIRNVHKSAALFSEQLDAAAWANEEKATGNSKERAGALGQKRAVMGRESSKWLGPKQNNCHGS